MNIKYSQKKQEMREDPVLEFFIKAKDYVTQNANMMMGIGAVVVVAVAILVFYAQMKASSQQKAQDAFGQAMIEYNNRAIEKAVEDFRIVADNYRGTPQGSMSAYMLGGIFMNVGQYDNAIQWFETAASKKSPVDFIQGASQEGIGGCYEAKGDVPKAIEYFQKALDNDRLNYRHPAILWKMALLNQKVKNDPQARAFCEKIIADSTASDYRQRAQNLLAVLDAAS